jgi:uncharacterized Zn finger protein (UPF0148 family)
MTRTFETCARCGVVLLWKDGQLVCVRRDCGQSNAGGAA